MPEPPQLAPFDAKEQRLYSELLTDDNNCISAKTNAVPLKHASSLALPDGRISEERLAFSGGKKNALFDLMKVTAAIVRPMTIWSYKSISFNRSINQPGDVRPNMK